MNNKQYEYTNTLSYPIFISVNTSTDSMIKKPNQPVEVTRFSIEIKEN